jgi:hypothetical protein
MHIVQEDGLSTIAIDGVVYAEAFLLGKGVHVFCAEHERQFVERRGFLLGNDVYVKMPEGRRATDAEVSKALQSAPTPSIPKADESAALVRVLSGIKPKRCAKPKKAKEEVESESSESEASSEDDDDVIDDEVVSEDD